MNWLGGLLLTLIITGCGVLEFVKSTSEELLYISWIAFLTYTGGLISPVAGAIGGMFGFTTIRSSERKAAIKELQDQVSSLQKSNEMMEGAANVGSFISNNAYGFIAVAIIIATALLFIPSPSKKITEKKEDKV